MLSVGQKFPSFKLKSVVSLDIDTAFVDISHDSFKGKWLVLFSWPKDFTFVCPTEIAEFGAMNGEFKKRGAQILGFSIDSDFVHLAWRQNHKQLKDIPFPMMSDIKHELSTALGILDPAEGVAQRATFIVDPEGVIRFVMVTDLSIGRNVQEVLRVLDALKTGGLTPCGWQAGGATIDVKKVAAGK